MRILFCTPCYKPYLGGVERVVEQFCRRLAARTEIETVGIMTSYYRYPSQVMEGLEAEEEIDGAAVFRLRFWPRKIPHFYHLDTGIFSPDMPKTLAKFKPTHVHYFVYDWFLPNLQAYLLSYRKAAQVQTIFNHRFQPDFGTYPFVYVNRWLSHHVDAVHVVTKSARQIVTELFGTPVERIKVVPLGAEVYPHRCTVDPNQPVTIVSVGRLSPRKGQLDLLRCFIQVRQVTDVRCRLVFIGGDGGDEKRIRQLIYERNLEDQVILTGYVSQKELEKWYASGDLFVLLTEDESFGLVFTEAMGAGLSVVSYNVGPLEDLLRQGAVLLPYKDLQAVTRALIDLVQDHDKRQRLGRDALAFVREHLSWDQVLDRMIEIYKTCPLRFN